MNTMFAHFIDKIWPQDGKRRWIGLSLALLPALLMGLYALGFASDLGIRALQENWLHEFFHDARHAAGFPCH